MFKVGDVIVYKQNVCKIKDIKEKCFNDIDYYILSLIDDSSMIISIPINYKNSDIRNLISKDEALKVIKSIPDVEIIDVENEKNIETIYKQLLTSGTYEDLIKIIKTTYTRNQKRIDNSKHVSEKDDFYLKKAEKILYNELCTCLNKSFEELKNYIIEFCTEKSTKI